MLAFVKMIFLVRRYGDSRHEDEAKRNPNGHRVDKTGSPGRGFPFYVRKIISLCSRRGFELKRK